LHSDDTGATLVSGALFKKKKEKNNSALSKTQA
jgi:hypothetical protein